MATGGVRAASHAGSWYTDDGSVLNRQLDGWLRDGVAPEGAPPAKAIIAPHAGFSYSGPTAGFAYSRIVPDRVKRVFVLGPSHHFYLNGCALSPNSTVATPVGDMTIDAKVYADLAATRAFDTMTAEQDEDEHSIEMHLPYVAKVMAGREFTIVPILVGSIKAKKEAAFGAILAPYFDDPDNVFVISSDFCHWGSRFRYQVYDKSAGAIHESIEALDKTGMALIEGQDPDAFRDYLARTENTICGRHPITVLLETMKAASTRCDLKFVRYAQSSACKSMRDSSVSYASGIISLTSSAK